jgi:hypothetical protein
VTSAGARLTPSPGTGLRREDPLQQTRAGRRPAVLAFAPGALLAAAVMYLAIACLLYWPVGPLDTTHVLHQANHDPAQTVWYLAWVPFALGHGLNPLHTGYLDVPSGANLATNTSVPLLGFLGWPVTALFSPVATFNLLMRVGLAGSAFAMFLVLRRWTSWWPAAFVGGLLYGFNSFTLQEAANHLHLVFLVLPPLILWAVDALFVTQRGHPVRAGLALGGLCALQWFVNDEVLVGCLFFAAVGLAVVALAHRSSVVAHLLRALPGVLAGGGLFVAVVAYPAWYLLAGPGHLVGPTQPRWVIGGYLGDAFGPLFPHIHETSVAPASVIAAAHPSTTVVHFIDNASYLGIPLTIALVLFAVIWRRASLIRLFVVLAAVAYLLSLGARLTVFGHRSSVPLPSALFAHLPLLYEITPQRFALFLFLFLAVVLAVGLDQSADALRHHLTSPRHAGHRRRWRLTPAAGSLAAVMAAAAVTASLVPMVVAAPSLAEGAVNEAAAATGGAAHTPPGGVVLYLPYIRSFAAQPMIWQAQAAMAYKTVGGYVIIPRNHYSSGNFVIPTGALAKVLRAVPSADPHRRRPPPPTVADTVAACRALPTVLRRYRVDTVVLWPAPQSPLGPGRAALSAAMGQAPIRAGRLLIWDDARARVRPGGCGALGG